MQPIALPRPAPADPRCHMCGSKLADDHRIITRDQQGNPRRFRASDCFTLWANYNISQFVPRSTR
jgi:Uma2 family endonuclease